MVEKILAVIDELHGLVLKAREGNASWFRKKGFTRSPSRQCSYLRWSSGSHQVEVYPRGSASAFAYSLKHPLVRRVGAFVPANRKTGVVIVTVRKKEGANTQKLPELPTRRQILQRLAGYTFSKKRAPDLGTTNVSMSGKRVASIHLTSSSFEITLHNASRARKILEACLTSYAVCRRR